MIYSYMATYILPLYTEINTVKMRRVGLVDITYVAMLRPNGLLLTLLWCYWNINRNCSWWVEVGYRSEVVWCWPFRLQLSAALVALWNRK